MASSGESPLISISKYSEGWVCLLYEDFHRGEGRIVCDRSSTVIIFKMIFIARDITVDRI